MLKKVKETGIIKLVASVSKHDICLQELYQFLAIQPIYLIIVVHLV